MDTRFKKIKKKLNIPRVILVRHGHTDLNNTDKSEDRIRGWVDVPLNDEGRKDAVKAAKKLEGTEIDLIFSSDLVRARETADIINKDHNVPIIDTMNLRPWNLGKFQGQVTDKVLHLINHHIEHPDEVVPDGESFAEFNKRYIGMLDHIIQLAIKSKEVIVITTHLRNLKLADGWVQNGMPDDHSVDPEVIITDEFSPGELYEIPINDYLKSKKAKKDDETV